MASYEQWNVAIAEHFTQGVPLGNAVYLSSDEEVIAQIGQSFADAPPGRTDYVADLCAAVRLRVVLEGHRVALKVLPRRSASGYPGGVAFLAVMVLAASRMSDEEIEGSGHVGENNYFSRLRSTLKLSADPGRPDGLLAGSEEPLWKDWNLWLEEQGFVPTARPGQASHRFINYPISQTLLRKADKDRLRRVFSRLKWHADWDGETLLINLQRHPDLVRFRYLNGALLRPGARYQALADALYELYARWRDDPQADANRARTTVSTLRCGLLRDYDPIFGALGYCLYPRVPVGKPVDGASIRQGDETYPLEVERPGWFRALGPLSAGALSRGARYPVTGLSDIHSAILPERSFWVLVPDPEEPDSGVHASWRHPALGEPAVVLIARDAMPLLQQLRDEGLVRWEGDPIPVGSLDDQWLEVRGCLVISEALGGVFGNEQAIFEELRPSARLGISTRQGLRSPNRTGWITGHGPRITISGFETEVKLCITRIEDDRVIYDRSIPCWESVEPSWDSPGSYRVEASAGGHEATPRIVRLMDWDRLSSATTVDRSFVEVGDWQIAGAMVRPVREGGR